MIEQFFDTPGKRSIAAVLLVSLFAVLYLAALGERPLFIPDETRYGEIAREMLATGNWIVPRLNGLLYFEKPPFGYWLNSASLWLFGETPFAVRFSSALSTAVAALTVFAMGRTFFKSASVPYLAAFVFLTILEVQAVGTFAVLDPIFAAVLNGGILAMASSAYSDGKRRVWLLVAAGALFGLAFLTKGFLAFALPALVLIPWLLSRKQHRFLFRYAWIAVVIALLVIAPWGLAIHTAQPDFWRYFFWVEHIQRFAAENAQHKEPFYFYLIFLPALGFPWIFMLPATMKGLRDKQAHSGPEGAILLLALWAVVPFVFFSASSGKLSTYILPCLAPFAVITAAGLASIPKSIRATRVSLSMALLGLAVFLCALIIFIARDDGIVFAADEGLKQIGLIGSLLAAFATLVFAMLTRRHHIRLVCVGVSMVPFLIALPFSLPESVLGHKAPEAFISQIYSQLPDDTVLVTNGSLVRAVSWSTKRSDVFVIENGGETTYGLEDEDGAGRYLSTDALEELVASESQVLILCKGPCNPETLSVLPSTMVSASYGNFFAHFVQPPNATKLESVPPVDRL